MRHPCPLPRTAPTSSTPASSTGAEGCHRRAALLWLATACAAPTWAIPPSAETTDLDALLDGLPPHDVLVVGEQHDADAHHALHARLVQWLAQRQRLGSLVLEMAERDRHTRNLSPQADATAVQAALAWHEAGWPWARYGPAVMAAVRSGVPVLGGNLPRAAMGEASRDPRWDALLPQADWQALQNTIAEAHCGLMPAERLPAMARIQLARDDAMARTLREAHVPGHVTLLLTGQVHADRRRGVPWHLERLGSSAQRTQVLIWHSGAHPPAGLQADRFVATPPLPPQDHCAGLRGR